MSLAKPTPLIGLGDIRGTIYDFEKAGDVLAKHVHSEKDIHITIVARGSVKTFSHDWTQGAFAGQIIDFRVGEPHEIVALEDNTRIVNILKNANGVPNDYEQV